MNAAKHLYLALACLLSATACGPSSQDASDPQFFQGLQRGHEDLIRWSVDLVGHNVYPVVPFGDRGHKSGHPMVRGSYATDFAEKVEEISLRDFYTAPGKTKLAYSSEHLDLHFLRKQENGQVTSARQSCQDGRERIIEATKEGLRRYRSDRYAGLFFFGHAIHAIQDSFSKDHTVRTPDMRTMLDVCTYGKSKTNACRHALIAPFDDSVWTKLICNKEKWECLKPVAQHAVLAGSGYLHVVQDLLSAGEAGIAQAKPKLEAYFDDPSVWNGGYFSCESLR